MHLEADLLSHLIERTFEQFFTLHCTKEGEGTLGKVFPLKIPEPVIPKKLID
jgi:hypothetical protein